MTLRLLGELSKSSYNSIFMGNDTFSNETHEHIVKWTCQKDNSHLHIRFAGMSCPLSLSFCPCPVLLSLKC